jgi:NAD/NADP transhydrogenase beta subunit
MASHHAVPLPASRPGRWKRWLAWGVLAALLLGVAVVLMVVLLRQPIEDLAQIEHSVRRWKYVGVLVQLVVIGAIGVFWKRIVAYGHARGCVQRHELQRVQDMRWKVVLALLVFQLVVVIGPGEFHRLARSGW